MRFIFILIFLYLSLSANSNNKISYTDMYKRDVQIAKNDKIVCLGPGCVRLITYMQIQDRLSGVENNLLRFSPNSIYTQALDKKFIKSLPIVGQGGPGKMPNLETLVNIKPDVIFTSILSLEQVNLIQDKTKIPVVALSYGTSYGALSSKDGQTQEKLEAIKDSIKLIGNIMQKQKRANELISFMNEEEKKIKELSKKMNFSNIKDSIYIGGVAYRGLQGITSTESDYPALKLLNINNDILKNHKGHAHINEETLLVFNPDIIFLDALSKKIVKDEIKKNQNIFKHIKAFKNQNIKWLYPSNFSNTNIENIYLNSWLISSYLGNSIDINATKNRIYSVFLGKNTAQKIEKLKILPSEQIR